MTFIGREGAFQEFEGTSDGAISLRSGLWSRRWPRLLPRHARKEGAQANNAASRFSIFTSEREKERESDDRND